MRKLGTRIPPDLWAAAVEMVGVHGAYRVARALNLDYGLVKQRAAVAGRKVTTTEVAPRFVELFAAAGAMPAPSALAAVRGRAGQRARRQDARGARRPGSGGPGRAVQRLPGGAMIQITPHMRILVAVEPIDFRAGIDGLVNNCRKLLQADPFSGALFVFGNRGRTAIKILVYDGQGFWHVPQAAFHRQVYVVARRPRAGPHAAGLRAAGAADGGQSHPGTRRPGVARAQRRGLNARQCSSRVAGELLAEVPRQPLRRRCRSRPGLAAEAR